MDKKIILFQISLILIFAILLVNALPLSVDLSSYYSFNETSGVVVDSQSGNNGSILTIGAGYGVTRGLPGVISNSFNFSASSSGTSGGFINFTNPHTDCYDLNCSISFWVNFTQTGNRNFYYQGGEDFMNYTIIDHNNGNIRVILKNDTGGSNLIESPFTSNNGLWQHVAVVFNTTSMLLYINSTLINNIPTNSTKITPFRKAELINARTSTTGGMIADDISQSSMDEFGIWNKSLNSTDIEKLYNDGLGFSYDSLNLPEFIIITPSNNSFIVNNTFNINVSVNTIPRNLTNITLYLYNATGLFNQTTHILSGNTLNNTAWNLTNFPLGDNYLWNVLACSVNEFNLIDVQCDFNDKNLSFVVGYRNTGQFSRSTSSEGNTEPFLLNLTIMSGNQITTAKLNYNNTLYSATFSQSGNDYVINKNLIIENILSNSVIDHYWNVTFNNGFNFKTQTQQQTVASLSVDTCGSNTILIYSPTVKDEETRLNLTGTADVVNVSVDLRISTLGTKDNIITFNHTYYYVNSTEPARVCIKEEVLNNTNYRMDVLTSYQANAHVTEFHNIQNFTLNNNTIPQRVELHDLLTTDSQEFLITFKDSTFSPVADALIDISRNYIGDGVFRSVEIPKTSNDGTAIAHLVLSDVIYTITVTKDGQLLGTFDNIVAFCNDQTTGDCKINLNSFSTGIQPTIFTSIDDLLYTLTYDQTTRNVQSIFNIPSGATGYLELNATILDNRHNTTICSSSVSSSSGTLLCNLPTSVGNTTVLAELRKNGNFVANRLIVLKPDSAEIFGGSRVIMLLILLITLPLLALTSGVATLVFLFIGIITASILNLYEGGGFIGVGATILWLVIGISILIWKISRRE